MASGDRIELLTANAFEAAIDTVAKETTVADCSEKIDEVHDYVGIVNEKINTILNDISTVYGSTITNYGVLADLYNSRIGATNNSGGTATAGTVMGKLNTLINLVNNLQSSSSTDLNTPLFIPSNNVLKSFVGATPLAPSGTYYMGCFAAKYSGTLRVDITGACIGNGSYNSNAYILINPTPDMSVSLHPGMAQGAMSTNPGSSAEKYKIINISALTTQSFTYYPKVKAGDMIYFYVVGHANNICSYTKFNVCGSVISSY